MVLFWLFFAYIAFYYIREYIEKRKYQCPPGPLPIPILGNCIQMALASDVPNLAIAKFSEKYGEIFTLKVGFMNMVIPASVEAINTTFSRSEAAGRDLTGSWKDRNFGKNLGVVFSEGELWDKTRTWLIRNLREYGFERSSSLETGINTELEFFMEELEDKRVANNGIVEIGEIFILPTFKIFWTMVAGHRTEEDDIVIHNLLEKSEAAIKKGVFGAGLVTAFPFIRFLFPEYTGHAAFMKFYESAISAAKGLIRQAKLDRSSSKNKSPRNFIESYVKSMEEEQNNPNTIFTEENFIVIFMDVLQASSDTTSSYLEALVLFMVLYPDVQTKVYEEIKEFVPKGQQISFHDQKNMVYTQASMLEVHRFCKVVQNLVPRKVTKDFQYKNYLIRKGTIMVADLHSAYNNTLDWKEPFTFSPERFIGKNEELTNVDMIMPFGVGKRLCPGETLASTTAFIFFTTILQKYKLSVIPGQDLPRQEMHVGITSKPFPFKILISERQ